MMETELPSFSDWISVFPLPNVVLLPGGTLPLQVYEPRYRAMVRDALADQAVIAMALLRPGYEPYYYTNRAKVYPIVCVGRIREHVQVPDGRYFVNLVGVCRARIREEDPEGEYRAAMLEPMLPAGSGIDIDGEYAARSMIRQVVHSSGFNELPNIDTYRGLTEQDVALTDMVDQLAANLLPTDSIEIRQRMLEEMDPLRRTGTLVDELRILHQRLEVRRRQIENPLNGSMN